MALVNATLDLTELLIGLQENPKEKAISFGEHIELSKIAALHEIAEQLDNISNHLSDIATAMVTK
jgi:hypothetical protein